MLDIQRIREFPDLVKQGIMNKRSTFDIDAILVLDAKRRETIKEAERLKNLRNSRRNAIGIRTDQGA